MKHIKKNVDKLPSPNRKMQEQITTLTSQLADAEEEIVGRGDLLADANRQIQKLRSALERNRVSHCGPRVS